MNQNPKKDWSTPFINSFLFVCGCLLSVASSGCVDGRSSTHELDHIVPPHWPRNLIDAADKMEARLATLRTNGQGATAARSELLELVEWLPEVAADTSLEETRWNEIHDACTDIRAMLGRSDLAAASADLQTLCARLRELDEGQRKNE